MNCVVCGGSYGIVGVVGCIIMRGVGSGIIGCVDGVSGSGGGYCMYYVVDGGIAGVVCCDTRCIDGVVIGFAGWDVGGGVGCVVDRCIVCVVVGNDISRAVRWCVCCGV